MYLLDANVFIESARQYYPFNVCPGFWDWLDSAYANGVAMSIGKVKEELAHVGDELSTWVHGRQELFDEPDDAVVSSLGEIAQWVQGQSYRADAKAKFLASADYYLIAHAHAHGHVVVTREQPAPDAIKSVKIPDVCRAFDVECVSPFEMLRTEGARFVLE